MDPTFGYSYHGMKHLMRDLPPQAPVDEQPQEQALDEAEERRQPDTQWTVYSMDVGTLDHLYSRLNKAEVCFDLFPIEILGIATPPNLFSFFSPRC